MWITLADGWCGGVLVDVLNLASYELGQPKNGLCSESSTATAFTSLDLKL